MWSLKVSWSSKITPRFLTELGVIVEELSWMVKSCCIVGVAGKTRYSCLLGEEDNLAQYLPGWAVGDVLSSMPRCLPGSLRSVQLPLDHLVEMRDRAVCHQHSNTMCLYDGTQWCSVCGEEEGSKNRSLRNSSDQLMFCGYLPSPGHLERPTIEIGFKPEMFKTPFSSLDRRIWWWTVSKAADRSNRMRTDDLESAFAIRRASVTEYSAVSVECPRRTQIG